MRYVELICRAARAAHEEHAGIGVRLSPVRLTAEEAAELARVARHTLGERVYVAIAAPGVTPAEDARTCLAAGDHAAERATAWRNLVNTADGEWILYVSVEHLGRAGGLRDTLRAIDEATLREALLREEADGAPSLPRALADAIEGSGVGALVQTRALCALHEAVSAAPPARRWQVAGERLPLLGLAADSRLEEQPQERLKGNLRWVQEAGAREARGAGAKQPLRAALSEALSGGAREEALAGVDLGAVDTDVLSPPQKVRKPREPKAPKEIEVKPPKIARRGSERAPAPRDEAQPSDTPRADAQAPVISTETGDLTSVFNPPAGAGPDEPILLSEPDQEPLEEEPTDPGGASASPGAAEPAPSAPPSAPAPSGSLPPREPAPLPLVPRARAPKAASWEDEPVPPDAASLIEQALRGRGEGARWDLRGGAPREVLERPPGGLSRPAPVECPVADEQAREALAAWASARGRLLDALSALGLNLAAISRVSTLPSAALEPAGDAAQALVDAAETALTRISEIEPAALPAALARDALILHNPTRGDTLLLLTPLHPLVLGAALARADLWRQSRNVPNDERGPILWALSRPLPTPARWPSPVGGALQAAAPLARLPIYETRPSAVSEATQRELGAQLTRRVIDLHPHARLGLRVVVDAARGGPLIEGVLSATLPAPGATAAPLPEVVIFASGAPAISESAGASVMAGRARLEPLPSDPAERAALAPHLEIVAPALAAAPTEGLAPSLADGALPVPIRLRAEGGWETRAPCRAVVGGATLERAVAAGLGQSPRGGFVTWTPAPSITGVASADRATWRALIAPELGPAPRVGPLLLIDERRGDARVAVLSQDARATARALTDSFKALGVRDTRPNVIESLVKLLARGGGALPLEGSPDRTLVGRVLERAVADALGDGAVVTPLRPDQLKAVHAEPRALGGLVAVGLALGKALQVRVGVAPTTLPDEATLPEAVTGLIGQLSVWAMRAGRPDRIAGAAARAVMAELLWPALLVGGPIADALAALLEGAAGIDVQVSAVVLAPAGHALVGKGGLKVGDVAVEVVALDHGLVQRVVLGVG